MLGGYKLDPFQATEQEILADRRMSYQDRVAIVQLRRQMLSDRRAWRAGQGAREGARRIRDGAGLIEGTQVAFESGADDQVVAYTRAMRRFYNDVQAAIEDQGGLEALTQSEIDDIALATGEQVYQEELLDFIRQKEIEALRNSIRIDRMMLADPATRIAGMTDESLRADIERKERELEELQR